ncbi:hypothetical protein SKDZ_09G0790 [Saccharomyces kudriavzevii ZP591]|nr:hypothetical protein SKDZ_09G0790 [Saccharomyces kudriavzevii ZP591]
MVNKSKTNGGNDTITNGKTLPLRINKGTCRTRRKKSVVSSIKCKNFGLAKPADDEEQVSKILDKMNHLKKFSADEGDDESLFVQWIDDISDTLSGLWCTGTFLKLLISSALSGRAKKWFDLTTEGIDDHLMKTYTLENFLALLSGEFDGARFLRRERFSELLNLPIDSEKSLEKFANISGLLTPYYLSSSATLDLLLTKLGPRLQKQLKSSAFPMTLDVALLMAACEFAKGASIERNDINDNIISSDATSSKKKKSTFKDSKKYKAKTTKGSTDIDFEKGVRKGYNNEAEPQIPSCKRRKQSEHCTQLSLAMTKNAETLPSENALANTYAPRKVRSSSNNSLDSFAPLKSNKHQSYVVNAIATLDSDRTFTSTTSTALADDKSEYTRDKTIFYDKPTDEPSLSSSGGHYAARRDTLHSMTSTPFKDSVQVPNPRLKDISGGDVSNGHTTKPYQAMHIFSRSALVVNEQTVKKTQFIKSNQIEDIINSNPFTSNKNEKRVKALKSLETPIASVQVNELSCFVDLEKPRSANIENKRSELLTQKFYPLHNFAVRTRNAHFSERPSNYTSAHGIKSNIRPLSTNIQKIQSFSRSDSRKADTNTEVISSHMLVQHKRSVNSENREGNRTFNDVTNPFLANTMSGTKQSNYYM